MNITKDIFYIGVNDRETDLFEGQYIIPNGIAYNSYLINDEKIAVFDTVDKKFTDEWLKNLETALNGRKPDYLIIQHMEPDHSANIKNFCEKYPETVIVGNKKTFLMTDAFFGKDSVKNKLEVADGDSLNLGAHTLKFIFAPMVHWPEVMVTFDEKDKILFSADAFGKFGALDTKEDWACEARRYYFGIVGKYGVQVQALLNKAKSLEIEKICPLHGPILESNLQYYLNLYDIWSKYEAESEGVCIAYTSVYGNTKQAALLLENELRKNGCKKVAVNDLARCDMAEAIEDAFRYEKLVLATTTYNGDIFPFMKQFIEGLTERNYQNRTVAFIENGSWGPIATKKMKAMLENSKNLKYCENEITIRSALTEQNKEELKTLAKQL